MKVHTALMGARVRRVYHTQDSVSHTGQCIIHRGVCHTQGGVSHTGQCVTHGTVYREGASSTGGGLACYSTGGGHAYIRTFIHTNPDPNPNPDPGPDPDLRGDTWWGLTYMCIQYWWTCGGAYIHNWSGACIRTYWWGAYSAGGVHT